MKDALQELADLSVWLAGKKSGAEDRMNIMAVGSRERVVWSYTVQAYEGVLKEVGIRMCDLEQIAKKSPEQGQLRFILRDNLRSAHVNPPKLRILQVYDYRSPGPLDIGKPEWYDVPLVEDAEGG